MGLTLVKLGEEAVVPLADFSVAGPQRAELRQAINRAHRDGASFEVISREHLAPVIPHLETVSAEWLQHKQAREKGFSLGKFSRAYIANFDCAVVKVDGQIVAFANLWQAPGSASVSVDLMRYSAHAPKVVMDYLFVELMLWAKARGMVSFDLGMAPLSGLEQRPLAPIWHKIGTLTFRYGEDFYNFEGLRRYKEKFDPQWRPRYMACAPGLGAPRAVLDAAVLIAGGFRGIWQR
jgi:phosphatidylglycerol lysyltransferase